MPTQTDAHIGPLFGGPIAVDRPGLRNASSTKHISPFRYPGGKSWLVPEVRRWIGAMSERPRVLVEPFAGGATVALALVAGRTVERGILCEMDEDVGAVWTTILEGSGRDVDALCYAISTFQVTRENCELRLARPHVDIVDRAFRTILRNRVNHGGILAKGASLLRNGEKGKGISSRWYPDTLISRIRQVRDMADRIDFVQGDAFDVLVEHAVDPTCAFFVDPPYTAAASKVGARLYTHSELDHEALFRACASLAGEAMLTYDDMPEVEDLAARNGLVVRRVPMKTTHHRVKDELLILKGPSLAGTLAPDAEDLAA